MIVTRASGEMSWAKDLRLNKDRLPTLDIPARRKGRVSLISCAVCGAVTPFDELRCSSS